MKPSRADSTDASRILVLDDEPMLRQMIVRWLRNAGHDCLSVGNVREALDTLQNTTLDLVISDIRMPEQSGFDLLARLQHTWPDQAVIMLTGSEDPNFATEAIRRGAWGYLLKPVEQRALLLEVNRVLERRRLFDAKRNYTTDLERRVSEQTHLVRQAHEEVIHRLVVASMVRDDETGAHIKRIGLFSAAVAEIHGWTSEDVAQIRFAAPMHDIGKIGIPDSILLKPGKLTDEEFAVMKTHTLIGAGILQNSHSTMMQLAEQIARSHHERWNGSGYPDGLAGETIPECARIVAIVDFYDALTHDRVYRKALPEVEALRLLEQGRGAHFDPQLLDVFYDALPLIRHLAEQETEQPNTEFSREMCHSLATHLSEFKPSPTMDRLTTTTYAARCAEQLVAQTFIASPAVSAERPLSRYVQESRTKIPAAV